MPSRRSPEGGKNSENLVLKDGFTPEHTNVIWKPENICHQVRSRRFVWNSNDNLFWTCRSILKTCGDVEENWSRGAVSSGKRISIPWLFDFFFLKCLRIKILNAFVNSIIFMEWVNWIIQVPELKYLGLDFDCVMGKSFSWHEMTFGRRSVWRKLHFCVIFYTW